MLPSGSLLPIDEKVSLPLSLSLSLPFSLSLFIYTYIGFSLSLYLALLLSRSLSGSSLPPYIALQKCRLTLNSPCPRIGRTEPQVPVARGAAGRVRRQSAPLASHIFLCAPQLLHTAPLHKAAV